MAAIENGPGQLLRYAVLAATGPFRHGGPLPEAVSRRRVRPDPAHLTRYARVCGFDLGDTLPPTFPHVLAFGDTLRLFARRDFGFPAIGLVHVQTTIEQLTPIRRDQCLTVRSRFGVQTEHRRGQQFEVLVDALVDDTVVWRSANRYLQLRRPGIGSSGTPSPEQRIGPQGAGTRNGSRTEPLEPGHRLVPPTATWRVPAEAGRRYAAVSGDPNPIHLHPLGALLAGRRRPIAHGMWLAARCISALASRLPEAYQCRIDFRAPVRLPGRVGFAAWALGTADGATTADRTTDGWDFQLRDLVEPAESVDAARVRLTGSVRRIGSVGR